MTTIHHVIPRLIIRYQRYYTIRKPLTELWAGYDQHLARLIAAIVTQQSAFDLGGAW